MPVKAAATPANAGCCAIKFCMGDRAFPSLTPAYGVFATKILSFLPLAYISLTVKSACFLGFSFTDLMSSLLIAIRSLIDAPRVVVPNFLSPTGDNQVAPLGG